jgi:hypothetical protein
MAEGKAVFTAATLEDKRNLPGKDHLGPRDGQQEAQAPITVIIGGRALLMLIAARFSGSGSGKRPSGPRDLADRLRSAAISSASRYPSRLTLVRVCLPDPFIPELQ